MPASDSGGAKTPAEARALVESLALDGGALTDADLSTISLPHSADQFSTELDCFVNIQAELDRMVEVEESFVEEVEESFVEGLENCNLETETVEVTLNEDGCMEDIAATPETILPDMVEETIGMEGMEVSEMIAHSSTIEEIIEPEPETTLSQIQDTTESVVFTSLNNSNQSQVSAPSIVVIQSPATAANVNNPTHLTVSNGQIVPLSSATNNKTISSVAAQNIAGSLIMSKPNEQCRFFQIGQTNVPKPVTVTSNIQGIRPLQGTIKRPATSGSLPFFAKVIIAGNQQGQQGQPVVISQPNNEAFPSQQIKIIGPGSAVQHPNIIGSPPKTITLAQAQQLGLLTTSKLQQILPSSSAKSGIVVNKLMTGPVKVQPKFTVVPSSGIRSPAKILPAPAVSGISQIKSVVPTSAGGNTTIKPLLSPQKVIIRQSTLKPAVVPGTGQVIRLPTSQNIIQNTANVGQFQLQGGKQVQYVRLVSTPSSTGNSITTLTNTSNASVTIVPKSVAKTATLTTIRTQQPAMKMVPIAPATPNLRAVVPKTFTSQPGQRILIPASATQIRPACSVALPTSGSAVLPSAASSYVVLPPECIQPVTSTPITNQKAELQAAGTAQINLSALSQSSNASQSSVETSPSVSESSGSQKASSKAQMEPNGIRPRKPCNCTKSQCLKLYCDCFANGEFCHQCNCNNCFNNLEHEEERQRAIKSCLERNPTAFRPKIGKGMIGDERRHNRGCNCKRSGCLKNYCECYEAKISCSPNCKCIGCRNVEDISSRPFNDFGDEMDGKIRESSDLKQKFTAFQDLALRHFNLSCGSKHPYGFMTNEVLTATCQCLLYQAEECERLSCSIKETEQIIIEEFGKCLVQIIEYANKSECMKSEANSLPP